MSKHSAVPPHKKQKTLSSPAKVKIRQLASGVRGLDDILGGGLPEFSFNIISGAPGCGKTTLAHQILFANATPEKPALYFTVLGEPALKMLRYQQLYSFFDPAKVNKAIRFINLSDVVLQKDLSGVLDEIIKEVTASKPSLVVVDSFRTVVRKALGTTGETDLQAFVQRLALFLTSWQATTFLIGEYTEGELRDNPVFTVADGLFWLTQNAERNSVVRKLQIMKLRGQASVPGLHTIRITGDGVQAFSRTLGLSGNRPRSLKRRRLSTGIAELDKMMGGGSSKATACSCPVRRGRESRRSRPSFSPKVCATESRGSLPSSRSARWAMWRARTRLASISRRRKERERSSSSICVRSTSRWTRRCRRSSTQ